MRCTFIELLASYDNTNYVSYLFIFSQQDIKHVGVCGSSANFSQKTFPEKITQNKVCICPKLCMYGSELFSLWALYLGKRKWPILLLFSIVFFYLAPQMKEKF